MKEYENMGTLVDGGYAPLYERLETPLMSSNTFHILTQLVYWDEVFPRSMGTFLCLSAQAVLNQPSCVM